MILFGLVSYDDRAHLEESLPAVFAVVRALQHRGETVKVVLQDNAQDVQLHRWLQAAFPDLIVQTHPDGNVGYGSGYNAILKAHPGSEIFAVITTDVVLRLQATLDLIDALRSHPNWAQLAGKLVTAQDETLLDSAGIWATKRFHFSELGAGKVDGAWVDAQLGKVLGISGAAFLIRSSVIESLHGSPDLLFTPHFWMYKEDIDLAFRLRERGLGIQVLPFVWGAHVRTTFNREGQGLRHILSADLQKKNWARRHSYVNHLLLLKMHPPWRLGWSIAVRVFFYEILKGFYLLFRSPRALFLGLRALLFSPVQRSDSFVGKEALKIFFH